MFEDRESVDIGFGVDEDVLADPEGEEEDEIGNDEEDEEETGNGEAFEEEI